MRNKYVIRNLIVIWFPQVFSNGIFSNQQYLTLQGRFLVLIVYKYLLSQNLTKNQLQKLQTFKLIIQLFQLHMSSIIQQNTVQNLKSRSLKIYGQQFQDSFFEQSRSQHTKTVMNALAQFITSSLGQNYLKYFGHFYLDFQTSNISQQQNGENDSLKFTEMIQKNQLLSDIQKQQFILDLRNQNQLRKLMEQLSFIQNQKTVSQLCYITFTIWERYLEFQRSFIVQNPIIPKFTCSKDLLEQIVDETPLVQIQKISIQQLLSAAENLANELYLTFLNDSKLLNITLRNIDINIPKLEMHALFREFLKTFIKAVYLCIQGYLQHPDSEQGNFDQYFHVENGWNSNFLETEMQNEGQLPQIFF